MGNDIRLAALVLLLGSLSAKAGEPPAAQEHVPEKPGDEKVQLEKLDKQKGVPEFGMADTDRDGSVSSQEAVGYPDLKAIFDEVDADKNGRLSSREYAEAKIRLEKK
jgi:hypothetical protein